VIATETKPSGLGIRFSSEKPRGYWLRDPAGSLPGTTFEDIFADPKGPADEDWTKVDSVTVVLGCLDKPALPWWGMRIGVEGTAELHRKGKIKVRSDGSLWTAIDEWVETNKKGDRVLCDWSTKTPEQRVVKLLTLNKLTVNHVRDLAGERGTSAHDAFEAFCETGVVPSPTAFPETERGYVQGLVRFIEDSTMEGGESEVMVGSWKHLFAGRYDRWTHLSGSLVSNIKRDKEGAVTGLDHERWDGERTLLDLKTSKGVYPNHYIQLEAYEGAGVECGYEATDERAVVHVTADGLYQVKRSQACYDDFLKVLAVHKAMKAIK
jgi:hypothetical protein